MQFYIFKGLGICKSLRISKILRNEGVPMFNTNRIDYGNYNGRRAFIKNGSVLFGGLLLAPILNSILPNKFIEKISAAETDDSDPHTDWREKINIKNSKELNMMK